MTKKGYYTPSEAEAEFDLKKSTMRKYANIVNELAEEEYFKTETINGRKTRIYNINELMKFQSAGQLVIQDRITIKEALQKVFFEEHAEKIEPETDSVAIAEQGGAVVSSLFQVVSKQNDMIEQQFQMIQQQSEDISRLIDKLDALTEAPEQPQIETETAAEDTPSAPKQSWLGKLFSRKKHA